MTAGGEPRGRDVVAVVLAIGIATAVNLLLFGVVYDAVRADTPGISENATQVIIAAFTGITGVLGGYIGARSTERAYERQRQPDDGASTSPATPDAPVAGNSPPSAPTGPTEP